MSETRQWRAYGMLIATTWCWGLNAIISRMAVGEISPMQLVTFRWLGVLSLLLVFARGQVLRDWPLLRGQLPFLFLMGALGFTAFNALFYHAGHHTSAINIGILQGSIPIFVLLGSLFVLKQSIGLIQWLGVAVTLLGVAIVATAGELGDLGNLAVNRGDGFMLIACFFYAAYSIGLTRRPNVSALALFAIMAIAAWLVSLPLVAIETWHQGWLAPTPKGWLLVALVALLPSLVAQLFFINGVALIGPGRAGVFVNLVPVFAALMAVLLLRERFEPYHALALALVLGGIALSEARSRN